MLKREMQKDYVLTLKIDFSWVPAPVYEVLRGAPVLTELFLFQSNYAVHFECLSPLSCTGTNIDDWQIHVLFDTSGLIEPLVNCFGIGSSLNCGPCLFRSRIAFLYVKGCRVLIRIRIMENLINLK